MALRSIFYLLSSIFLLSGNCRAAGLLTPFVAYTTDFVGDISTNPVTIQAWAQTNVITGVATNLVVDFHKTYQPAASNGFFAGYLAPGNYRLTVSNISRGITFGISYSASTQNLAQLAGVPVYAFQNFTVAQFSDAGTAAYSNANVFHPHWFTNWPLAFITNAGSAAYSNAAAFTTPTQATNAVIGRIALYSNAYHGSFTGNAAGLTNLQATAFDSGSAAIAEAATLLGNFVGKTSAQTISGNKTFTGTVLISNLAGIFHVGTIYSTNINGIIGAISNGVWWSGKLHNPTLTNGVNYGNAFRSPGSGTGSEQFGLSAAANGDQALAIGNSAGANENATAIGNAASAEGQASAALGNEATAVGSGATAVGVQAVANADSSTAIGSTATVADTHTNSVALGSAAATTKKNQIMLGGAGHVVSVSGSYEHVYATGTNSFSDLSLRRYAITSLANGNNAGVIVGTNSFVEVSGPSADFTIAGMTGSPSRNGHLAIVVNQTGFNMTVAHQSGLDAVAANRIITMTGADRVTTANGVAAFIYSAAASRWLLISFDP